MMVNAEQTFMTLSVPACVLKIPGDDPMERPPVTSYYRLLTKKDVAEMIGCAERTVDRLVSHNQIPFTQVPWGTGGKLKRRFIFGAIAEWMEQNAMGIIRQNPGVN